MLYTKFKIQDNATYKDFEKLYAHMVAVRQPGHEFVDDGPELDWDTIPEEEVDAHLEILYKYLDEAPEERRCKALMPAYVTEFLEGYLKHDNDLLKSIGTQDVRSILSYLEADFEVDLDALELITEQVGMVRFSTGNYPFGGMERFFLTLKAFGLVPIECFDGFAIAEFEWTSMYSYEVHTFPEKTKEYIKIIEKLKQP